MTWASFLTNLRVEHPHSMPLFKSLCYATDLLIKKIKHPHSNAIAHSQVDKLGACSFDCMLNSLWLSFLFKNNFMRTSCAW